MTKLEAIVASSSSYHQMSAFDWEIVVCDAEGKVLAFHQAETFKTNIKVGDNLSSGAIKKCLATHEGVIRIVPAEVYGFKLRAVVRPIFEANGEFAGVIVSGTTLKLQDDLGNAAQSIAAISQEMSATTEELAAAASNLADKLATIKEGSEHVLTEIKKTDDILKFVSEVADNSNLLGLNAAIEAARAGEMGRGFAVVAEEIRKMAVNSAHSVKDIKTILQAITADTQNVVKTIAASAELGERQAAATEEMSSTMQQLTATALNVEKIAEDV